MEQSDVIVVREYLNKGTTKPVTSTELMHFWKSLTPEEKTRFGNEARALNNI
jgi:hypothetical protein